MDFLLPAEYQGLFDIVENRFPMTGVSTPVAIALADSSRVALMLSSAAIANTVALSTIQSGLGAGTTGFALTQQSPNLLLTSKDWGPAVAKAWFAAAIAGTTVSVIEVFLRRKPAGLPAAAKQASDPKPHMVLYA